MRLSYLHCAVHLCAKTLSVFHEMWAERRRWLNRKQKGGKEWKKKDSWVKVEVDIILVFHREIGVSRLGWGKCAGERNTQSAARWLYEVLGIAVTCAWIVCDWPHCGTHSHDRCVQISLPLYLNFPPTASLETTMDCGVDTSAICRRYCSSWDICWVCKQQTANCVSKCFLHGRRLCKASGIT